jgi:Uma2 family endonuclease
MVIATQMMSLEDYLNYDDDTDTRYELEDGELLIMPSESDRNLRIASFLLAYFLQIGIPSYRLRIGTEVVVSGTRATVRLPDLMVLTEELAIALQSATRSTVTIDMPPPQLIVEVVSPGKKNIDRDYRYKRSQYQARGIAEYWIVDPIEQRITVLNLVEGLYEEAIFEGNKVIASDLLLESQLTAAQVLQN